MTDLPSSVAPDAADTSSQRSGLHRFYGLLEDRVFPRIIAWTIHPIHILVLLILWVALLVIHSTLFELVGGNYTNGLSAMAASIVLLQQTRQHREIRRLHHRHDQLLHQIHRLLSGPDDRR